MAEQRNNLEPAQSGPQSFLLQRLRREHEDTDPCLAVTGSILRQGNVMSLQYRVSGDIGDLVLPVPAGPGLRRNGLWQHSCFEVFLGAQGAARYWEVNLAPSGDWNVYTFSGYRQGMAEEMAIGSLPFAFHGGDDEAWLDLQLNVKSLFRQGQGIEAGISAVMEHRDGVRSYWALCHQGTEADFHHRSGFLLVL